MPLNRTENEIHYFSQKSNYAFVKKTHLQIQKNVTQNHVNYQNSPI